jgi:probable HAF family extracellular repeat protein
VVGLFVMMASLALAFVVFFILAFSNIGFEGGAPPALRTGTNLLMGAGWAYLFAAGAVGKGWWSRTPVPFLVAGILLVVAEILTVQAQFHLQQLSSFRETLEPWILPLGIAGALLALAAAWLLQRPSAARAIATMVALAAASAAIVLFTMRSYAAREASERVCPHLAGAIEGEIKRNVTIPDSYLRGARIQQSALNHAHWFVVADLQTNAKDFQGYTGPVVWLIDAPGASSQRMVEADRDRNQRIYAVNALAYSASKFPKKTMSAATLTRLDDCTKEVQREVSGMLGLLAGRLLVDLPSSPPDTVPMPSPSTAVPTPIILATATPAPSPVPLLPTIPPVDTTTDGAAYDILDLGTGSGNWSSAYEINERGEVLWTWATNLDPMSDRFSDGHAMLWRNGTSTDLTDRGIDFTRSITDDGTVLGGSFLPGPSPSNLLYHADSGTVTPLGAPDAFDGRSVIDVNNSGAIVGWVAWKGSAGIASDGRIATVPVPPGFTFIEATAINEFGQIAGRALEDPNGGVNQRAVLFADGSLTVLDPAPGAKSSSADDLNDVGQVVGSPGFDGSPVVHQKGRAFLYDHATNATTDLGTLPGYQNSIATAINNVGQVVGYASLPEDWLPENRTDQFRRAFVYDHRTGVMTDLNELIPRESGWYLVDAFDINDSGQIVGRGFIGGEMHAFVLTLIR